MKFKYVEKEILYDGEPLKSLWAFRQFDLQGDSIVAFEGPCRVEVDQLVDLADAKAGAFIFSRRMLHFIAEHFDMDLEKAVWKQRALTALAQDELNRRLGRLAVERRGNDLWDGDAKISVSIATRTPVSCKIHFGINVDAEGAPVKAKGLRDFNLDAPTLAQALLLRYREECEDVWMDRCKVRGTA